MNTVKRQNPRMRRIFQVDLSDDSRLAIFALSQTAADNIVARQAKRENWKSAFDGKPLTVIRESKKNPSKSEVAKCKKVLAENDANEFDYIKTIPISAGFDWEKNPARFYLVDKNLKIVNSGNDFDKLQSAADRHNENNDNHYYVISWDDLRYMRTSGKDFTRQNPSSYKGTNVTGIYHTMLADNNLYHILYGHGTATEKAKAKRLYNKSLRIAFKQGNTDLLHAAENDAELRKILGIDKRNGTTKANVGGVVNPFAFNKTGNTLSGDDLEIYRTACRYLGTDQTDRILLDFYNNNNRVKLYGYLDSVLLKSNTIEQSDKKILGLFIKRLGSISKQLFSSTKNETASDFKRFTKDRLLELSKMFQGEASGAQVRVLSPDMLPRETWRLGYLVQMKIRDNGKTNTINFDGQSYLSGDLRCNLWAVGKDARIEGIQKPPKGQLRKLGKLIQVDYVTAKKHIEGGKVVRFWHPLGEVNRDYPTLYIDHDGFPIILGGGYDIWNVGIVN